MLSSTSNLHDQHLRSKCSNLNLFQHGSDALCLRSSRTAIVNLYIPRLADKPCMGQPWCSRFVAAQRTQQFWTSGRQLFHSRSPSSKLGLDADSVIHCGLNSLFAAKIAFCGLN